MLHFNTPKTEIFNNSCFPSEWPTWWFRLGILFLKKHVYYLLTTYYLLSISNSIFFNPKQCGFYMYQRFSKLHNRIIWMLKINFSKLTPILFYFNGSFLSSFPINRSSTCRLWSVLMIYIEFTGWSFISYLI